MKTEKTLLTYLDVRNRLQLLKITNKTQVIRYQVRLNRKIIQTSISEYQMRKLFATYCQNIILQLKIY